MAHRGHRRGLPDLLEAVPAGDGRGRDTRGKSSQAEATGRQPGFGRQIKPTAAWRTPLTPGTIGAAQTTEAESVRNFEKSSPDLAKQIYPLPYELMRSFTSSLLRLIFRKVPIHLADEILEALHSGRYGDTELRKLCQWSADRAWSETLIIDEDIDEAEDAGAPVAPDILKRQRAEARVMHAFRAAYYALDPDPVDAIGDTIDQAFGAIPNNEVLGLLERELGVRPRDDLWPPGMPRFPKGWSE